MFKILIIGDSGVGKTNLLARFADDVFSADFISTIGIDFKIRTIEVNDIRIRLQIWDTAGQERFRTITTSYYRGALGIMLVYDITCIQSFENIKMWLQAIEQHARGDVKKMILGSKSDLENDRRSVSIEQGRKMADEYNCLFMETSAKTNLNVQEAFFALTLEILKIAELSQLNKMSIQASSENDGFKLKKGCC